MCTVIWTQPTIFAPASGLSSWPAFLSIISAGMSTKVKHMNHNMNYLSAHSHKHTIDIHSGLIISQSGSIWQPSRLTQHGLF